MPPPSSEPESDPSEDGAPPPEEREPQNQLFPTTQWSKVLKTRSEAGVDKAMNDLCTRYWHPIYAYLRGRGFDRADAQDITQSFFMKAVTDGLFQSAEEERGRLRSFLLGALTRHLSVHFRRERAVKRGGRAIVIPIECEDSEQRYATELVDLRDPESIYLASWARQLFNRALAKLKAHYEKTDRGELFAVLEPVVMTGDEKTPYRELAEKLHTQEGALRIQVYRTRQRFGKFIREEVAQTVHTPEELREELDWLVEMLRWKN